MAKKLGIGAGCQLLLIGAPENYADLVAPLPEGVEFKSRPSQSVNLVHFFTVRKADLVKHLASLRAKLDPEAVVWVSWPKKAAKMPTDITEDTIRDVELPLGFVDIKVCAVDAVWSGLKLVVRKELRP